MPLFSKESAHLHTCPNCSREVKCFRADANETDKYCFACIIETPEFHEGVRQGLDDYHNGKTAPWMEAMKELGLKVD